MAQAEALYASQSLKAQVIKLSICDVYSPKVWVAQTHFWALDGDKTFEKAVEALKTGFRRTVTEVPTLAATTGRTSDDPRDLIITIHETSSIEILIEDLTGNDTIPSYHDLKSAHFPMTGLIVPFSAPITQGTVYDGAPMIALKFNKLKGGMAMSFAFNHLLVDATSIAEIERIWSLHTADVSQGRPEARYKSNPDDEVVRERMSKPPTTASTEFKEPHWAIYPPEKSQLGLPANPLKKETALSQIQAKVAELNASTDDMPKWCMWHFTVDALAKLKADCTAGLSNGDWVSTNDALIGLFWNRVSHLKKGIQPDLGHDSTTLLFPVNIRGRLNPPLPPQYIGNAVDIIAADAALADVEDPTIKGWTNAAQIVRKTVTSWNQGMWESWLATVKALPKDQAIVPDVQVLFKSSNLAFNDYSRSQSNTLDWGSDVGRADRTRYMKPAGSMKGCATAVIVYPRLSDGSLEVATTCTAELEGALKTDLVFTRYAKLLAAFA